MPLAYRCYTGFLLYGMGNIISNKCISGRIHFPVSSPCVSSPSPVALTVKSGILTVESPFFTTENTEKNTESTENSETDYSLIPFSSFIHTKQLRAQNISITSNPVPTIFPLLLWVCRHSFPLQWRPLPAVSLLCRHGFPGYLPQWLLHGRNGFLPWQLFHR